MLHVSLNVLQIKLRYVVTMRHEHISPQRNKVRENLEVSADDSEIMKGHHVSDM